MIRLKLVRRFDPLSYFKDLQIIVDGCLFDCKDSSNEINLPDGTYLIQAKLSPGYLSNTIIVTERDDGKTILIYTGIRQWMLLTIAFILWIITLVFKVLTNLNIFELPLLILSAILLVSFFFLSKNRQIGIKISTLPL